MNMEAIFQEMPTLSSESLTLKKITEQDLDAVFSIYDNERIFDFCGIIPKHNKETVRKMIGHFERDFLKRTRVKWGIFQQHELVGIIEALDFNQKVNMVTVGYLVNESYWGKGIATEAVRVLIQFLFEKADINRIQAEVMPQNENSKRVLLKNGFSKEGLLRQATLWSGKGIVDIELYGLLKADIYS
ncbi:GNAT family N-acetyltransferase [Bacillus sp. JJ1764]|uniref:GNAT family N-acetyltransferase n=1 Tax=Bacillus sp. JJ1764 TaxID=3122964 RepID=UPI002FFD7567